ncbi:putative ferric-chelate reductase 1 [Sardina pilchardus]|uniref:putative ferric-chelate reductase 1 n=1 Tax=Sardina pilchardus TaxID=27697 RepID=UPI002E0E83C0
MDKLFSIFLGLSCVMFATAQVTVSTLNTTITNATCGTDRACISNPVSCNPATDSSCLFVSTKSDANGNLNFELRGNSSGYIAVALSTDSSAGGDDKTYICANNNSAPLFVFALLGANNTLTTQNDTSSISNVSASISQSTIQCVFDVSGLNATSRANAATTFSVVLASGTVSADGTLSPATVRTVSEPLDLSNASSTNTATATVAPSTNSTNTTNASSNATTTAATTAASGGNISLQHGLSQAVLILLGVLAIGMM